jgi:hypothetical protein
VVSGVLGLLLTGVGIFAGLVEFRLTEANKVEAERHKVACESILDRSRREADAYASLVKSVGSLIASAEQGDIKSSFPSFLSEAFGASAVVTNPDVSSALSDLIVTVEDYRSDWATLDRVKVVADHLIRASGQAVSQARASIEARSQQGC